MTKMGMHRTIPQIPLKRKTPLSVKKGLNKMSDKAKEEMKTWLEAKYERMRQLLEKYGFIPCEYCKQIIIDDSELWCAEGHHLDHNRRNNSEITNCRIVHASCHTYIHDHNIKDVSSLL